MLVDGPHFEKRRSAGSLKPLREGNSRPLSPRIPRHEHMTSRDPHAVETEGQAVPGANIPVLRGTTCCCVWWEVEGTRVKSDEVFVLSRMAFAALGWRVGLLGLGASKKPKIPFQQAADG